MSPQGAGELCELLGLAPREAEPLLGKLANGEVTEIEIQLSLEKLGERE